MPRTMTVSVCVAALPPMPATTGMNTASAVTTLMVFWKRATTDAARNAVARLTISHGSRLRKRLGRTREHAVVAGQPGEAIHVLGRFVLDDVDDVVNRDDADQLVLLVHDRDREQVVGRDQPRDLLLVHVHPDADDVRGHDPLERRGWRDEQQTPQRDDADEMTPRVDDVEIEDDLDVTRPLQRGDGLARRHVLGQREDLRVHDAAGRLLGVLEQLADVAAGGPLLHQLEDRGRQLLGQVVDDRGGVVGRQVLDQLDDLVGGPIGEQAGARLGSELAQTPPLRDGCCARRAARTRSDDPCREARRRAARDRRDAASAAGSRDSRSPPCAGGASPNRARHRACAEALSSPIARARTAQCSTAPRRTGGTRI